MVGTTATWCIGSVQADQASHQGSIPSVTEHQRRKRLIEPLSGTTESTARQHRGAILSPPQSRFSVPKLHGLVEAGLTSLFAIGLVTGISEKELGPLVLGRIEPTNRQRKTLERLLRNYEFAIRLVNSETLKGRL